MAARFTHCLRRRQYLAAVGSAGAAGCPLGNETGEPATDVRGELDVTLRNGLDTDIEARFLLNSPDGVPIVDARPEIPPDEAWQAKASGLVPGRYAYTIGAPRVSATDFWALNEDCPRFVIDAVVTDEDAVNVSENCEPLETESDS